MATIVPEGEAYRNAVKWISGNLQDNPELSLQKLINEAIVRFNLSPKESEQLLNFYRKNTA
ncbi:MAG TPA: hypothetical protein PLG17_03880 [Thermodesulfobacteriota bacterium]|nr:hypothetical protein [Thermodesulfobacteriota bacterium]HNU70550.1 hypothetical protein [Thermodesulfobacteriota bacterium]HQO77632.1 hypothetical protein [Thermodesulfobacteriota bacterium]